jgi:2-polyprenyl-6-methoxyphenol hydroxylase-like FAD-dependent oxidoreductase
VVAGLRDYERARIPRTRRLVTGSRQLSMTEQLDNPLACTVRDLVLKHLPMSVFQRVNMEPMRFTVDPLPVPAIGQLR